MTVISAFFAAFFYVVFTQNIVLTGGYGISEAIRTAARPKQLFLFGITIVYFSTFTSLICRLLTIIPAIRTSGTVVKLIIYTVVLTVLYIFTALVLRTLLSGSSWNKEEQDKLFRQTSVAAFNTIVFAVPFINQKVAYTVYESVAQGIGAGIAFVIATYIIHIGMKKLESNSEIPDSFKGAPALFMYIAILSLAFTGITGTSLFF